jgi:nitrite reductase/ring-hydroxylating ferredoxin subunit
MDRSRIGSNKKGAGIVNADREVPTGGGRAGEMDKGRSHTKSNWFLIASVVIVAAMTIGILLAPLGCAKQDDISDVPIKAAWIEPQVAGDSVSIPVGAVENNRNVHFKVEMPSGDMQFMAYILDAQTYVRASVCPPCRGIGYSLAGDVLVCDTCATTFKARTGEGIRGACVDYPKAAVPYEITDGSIVMTKTDLRVAYQDTLETGLP